MPPALLRMVGALLFRREKGWAPSSPVDVFCHSYSFPAFLVCMRFYPQPFSDAGVVTGTNRCRPFLLPRSVPSVSSRIWFSIPLLVGFHRMHDTSLTLSAGITYMVKSKNINNDLPYFHFFTRFKLPPAPVQDQRKTIMRRFTCFFFPGALKEWVHSSVEDCLRKQCRWILENDCPKKAKSWYCGHSERIEVILISSSIKHQNTKTHTCQPTTYGEASCKLSGWCTLFTARFSFAAGTPCGFAFFTPHTPNT